MTHKIEYSNGGATVEIEYDADRNMMNEPDMTAYMLAIEDLRQGGELAKFTVTHLTSPATDYTYKFETSGGAKWNQVLRFTIPPLSSGSYDMFDLEKVIEKHQVVRRLTIGLIKKYQIKKIEIAWE